MRAKDEKLIREISCPGRSHPGHLLDSTSWGQAAERGISCSGCHCEYRSCFSLKLPSNLLQYCFGFMFRFFGPKVGRILAPLPGIKPCIGRGSLNHWTAKEGPIVNFDSGFLKVPPLLTSLLHLLWPLT